MRRNRPTHKSLARFTQGSFIINSFSGFMFYLLKTERQDITFHYILWRRIGSLRVLVKADVLGIPS